MGKFNLSTKGGQLSEIEKRAQVALPTQEVEQAAPESPPSPSASSLDQLMAGPQAQTLPPEYQADVEAAVPGAVEAGVQAGLEVERQAVPSLKERAQNPAVDNWNIKRPNTRTDNVKIGNEADGGLRTRAQGMVKSVQEGKIAPSAGFIGESPTEGSFASALNKAGAITKNEFGNVPNPEYAYVASVVTENTMADLSFDSEPTAAEGDPVADAFGADPEKPRIAKPRQEEPHPIKQAQASEKLGQSIHLEYQRLKGEKVPSKLPAKEAAVVGQVFKDMWARQNPSYVKKFKDADGVTVLQLTAEGADAIQAGDQERKRLFPKTKVKPAKTPLPTGKLPGDVGRNVVKNASGRVGKPEFSDVIEDARKNLATVPNVVDRQRGKILLSTILPVLQSRDHNSWMAEINNFGPSKLQKYAAAKADQERRLKENPALNEEPYIPQQVLNELTNKIAQEVQAIAQERNGANYLSYGVQAFNGRISPQQTVFDPTTSKAVRFVTRNATPSIAKPGTRIEKNLRQMYAMMLVKGADAKLPDARDAALVKASPQLEQWGNRLAEALVMTDQQYDALSQAIADGKPLQDPVFQDIPALALDPQQDAELIQAIESKGEDGPHFIDGLIDYAKYSKAKRNNQPYASYFNAYIDGKTNGIASNGIQMGSLETAEATGVLRDNTDQLLDNGDIRDQLKTVALESVDDGWDGLSKPEIISDLNTVARAVFSHRDFNKATTMTFGYGKEINSFGKDIEETISLLSETDPAIGEAADATGMSRADLAKTLLNKYASGLQQVLSDDAIQTRALMRGSAALFAATNNLYSIKSYTGMDLNLGRDLPTSREGEESTRYSIYEDGKRSQGSVYSYDTETTSAAARSRTDEEGNVTSTPGEYAYGGSLPGPVQSLDAATVAMSASGKSWDRLKMNSGGNPYMHTIYDAFKADANGFDVVVEEVNKNWMEAASKWSYLEESYRSTKKMMKKWREDMAKRDPNSPLSDNEKAYMTWMLSLTESKSGNFDLNNFRNKISKFKEFKSNKHLNETVEKFKKEMRSVGYDTSSPPEKPTVRQLKTFVELLNNEMALAGRYASAINRTNQNKAKVVKQLKERGYKTPSGERIALQYYAH